MKLVIFDVDGTLVDSQATIHGCMETAFAGAGLPPPSRADVLSIVGLSLPQAMARLAPAADTTTLVDSYKQAYRAQRMAGNEAETSPLYPGARAALLRLNAREDVWLGVATGKSKRGLDGLIAAHDLHGLFVTRQVADHHPSKPHPSMLMQAMADVGARPDQAVMVGDTTYDMDMAMAAGMPFIGVSWGYHATEQLGAARAILGDFAELDGLI
ncbi:MAG: HAD-IA family hydrolase [Pseudomonadota bacterium]